MDGKLKDLKDNAFMAMDDKNPDTWPRYFLALIHPTVQVKMFFREEGSDVVCYMTQQYQILGKLRRREVISNHTMDTFIKERKVQVFVDTFK
ncbi:hypothetical protein LCGC14_1119900, partial [marine sediment metagenome]